MATTSKIPRTMPSYVGLLHIGFGVFDFLMAPRLADGVGMKDGRVFRAAGVREIITGAGAVLVPASPIPLVGRLMGDAADLAILSDLGAKKTYPRQRAALIGVGLVLAVTALDVIAKRSQFKATRPI
jgi:hypothetical protein